MQLNLLTFNTLGTPVFAPDIRKRYLKTAELINASEIDVVCLQEIFSHYNKHWFNKGLTNFPYRVYKPFVPGLHGGLAMYSRIPLEFVNYKQFVYPKGMRVPFYTLLARSGILMARFKDIPLNLATTHLASDVVHNLTPENKLYKLIQTQLEQTADVFNKLAETNNTLLAGDFNLSTDSQLYDEFIDNTHALDLFKGDTTPSYANNRIPYIYIAETSRRIDYIFYKGKKHIQVKKKEMRFGEKVESKDGKPFYLSDHTALFTSIVV